MSSRHNGKRERENGDRETDTERGGVTKEVTVDIPSICTTDFKTTWNYWEL